MSGSSNPATADTPQVLLEHHLKQLRLPSFLREYDKLARQCAAEQADYPQYLLRLSELELLDRERRATERRIHQARFPVVKSLETFEFAAIPSLNNSLVLELARCEFIERKECVLALGNPGTGKTHLALALGLAACQKGYRVRFTATAAIVHELIEARDEKRLLRFQKQMASCELLIVDELGFVPLSKSGAELIFGVFSQRYERGSTMITSNLPFQEWTKVLGSERLTAALLDRLTHLVHILEMNGESFRLKQSKRKRATRTKPRCRTVGENAAGDSVFRSGLNTPPCGRCRPPLQTPSPANPHLFVNLAIALLRQSGLLFSAFDIYWSNSCE